MYVYREGLLMRMQFLGFVRGEQGAGNCETRLAG